MVQQITNMELSKDIGDLKGSIGEIKGLLVGISKDLAAGSEKFVAFDSRLRKVETKVAVYTAAASVGGGFLAIFGQFILERLFA